MGYSLRIPLPGGKLKIKSRSRLRQRETEGKTPLVRFLGMYVFWERYDPARKNRRDAPMF